MRVICHLWMRCGLAISSLSLIGAVVFAEGDARQGGKAPANGQAAKRDAKEAAKLVDAIANRNKPPKIVKRRSRFPSELPLFPKDYDWNEEERVYEALSNLYQDESVELWEALVQKANDRRYCITLYSGNTSDAYIVSVGRICHGLAYGTLCHVFSQHLPSLPPHGCPIQLGINDLSFWREERKDKSFYQLQIEACEIALRKLPKVRVTILSDQEKVKARKKIEAEMVNLRKTKRPSLAEPGSGFPAAYPRGEAERVRDSYEKGTLEEFKSNLNK